MEFFLREHASKNPVSFHMPGHKGAALYREFGYDDFLEQFMDWDITEIPGADNLFQCESIIQEIQDKYAELYDVNSSYILINGTSGGLIAAVMATVPRGGKLIMARNCHKSVFNALQLADVQPVYVYPELIEEYGISGAIDPKKIEKCIDENPEAAAVILASPNYYGICSDINAIVDICHKNNKIVIIDQAHGAHLKFFHKYGVGHGMPLPAEMCGADIVVNSIHKTLASMTQSAVLNLNSDFVDRYVLEDKLQVIQSTSPSYILMESLDINIKLLANHGIELMKRWRENLDWFYKTAKNIKIINVPGMDFTKINIDGGIAATELEKILMNKNIFPELTAGNVLMCMTGIGNRRCDFEQLIKALSETNHKHKKVDKSEKIKIPKPGSLHKIPEEKEYVKLPKAVGRIAAMSIIPYPPGIPLICPGEELTIEVLNYIEHLRENGEKVIGVNDKDCISVGK